MTSSDSAALLLIEIEALIPDLDEEAVALDSIGMFPAQGLAALTSVGLLAAPVPSAFGGLGAGLEPPGRDLAITLLRLLGRSNLAVARLFEAHLNALRLAFRFGSRSQCENVAADAMAGRLFGLWVTDPPEAAPLRIEGDLLMGGKGPASGAGHCTRALVTVGDRMAVVALTGAEKVTPIRGLQGMRMAANGIISLDGARVLFWLGAAGDYLREPDFSCGAWRGSAAASGALDALVREVAAHLQRKTQAEAPLQLARFGEMLIAQQTARLWTERAAAIAEAGDADPLEQVATVNLARIAVETACLDALRHAQRSLGLAAFMAPNRVERIARDLGTYLRQPAPDAVLLEASAWHLRRR